MTIEFPPRRQPSMAGSLDMARLADEAAASAATADARATFTRIAFAARRADAVAMSPQADAAFQRAVQAFEHHDATTAARTTELQGALNRSLESVQPSSAMGPINASFSLIRGRLPEAVQATIDRIEEDLDEVRAARRNLVDDQQDLIQQRGAIVSQIRMNTEPAVAERYSVTNLMSEDHPTLKKLRADQARIDKQLAKISDKLAASQPRFEALDRLFDRCREYARFALNNGAGFAFHDGKAAGKKPGDLKQAIADARQSVAEILADLREHRARPRRSADVKLAARQLVEATAKAPQVAQAIDHGDAILWPQAGITAEVVGGVTVDGKKVPIPNAGAAAFGGINDALGIMMWAFKDSIVAAIDREIDLYADDANALSAEDRASGEAELLTKLLAAERVEEALIRQAEQADMPVYRRGDADVRVVLGLDATMPPLAEI
ncbi:hypothetical protein RX330_20440 [Bradyrhizobium sp. NDS-1]|uniref:hypothetical protein n=1 Tax=Bradyrhizobium sp. NDS-1 TaxID=3080014 RepID=UPI00293F56D6|nr:hypothetical protein [Bradyrhizobium sp. NDS-1]WOH70668.1 hypothetical protein RX330_20440 [Bradyrhizobium sp. NDS-1]